MLYFFFIPQNHYVIANHVRIIEEAGLEYEYYFYWDKEKKKLDIDKWIEAIMVY